MKRINVREARQQLSTLVDAAEQGDVVVITRHGKEVAQLGPIEASPGAGLPDLREFRELIGSEILQSHQPLSETVHEARERTRY